MLYFAIILVVIGILCLIYVSIHQQGSAPAQEPALKNSLFNVRYPERKTDAFDERIRNERQFILNQPEAEEDAPPEVVGSEESDIEEEFETEFTMEGTLYLDRSRKIPFADSRMKQKNLVDEFSGLTREGHGIMTEDKGVFHFRTGNTTHSYTVNDLEQIVFFDQGIALLPFDRSLAAPLFLAEDVSPLKEFLTEKKKTYLPAT